MCKRCISCCLPCQTQHLLPAQGLHSNGMCFTLLECTAPPLLAEGVILGNTFAYCYTFILNHFERMMSVR